MISARIVWIRSGQPDRTSLSDLSQPIPTRNIWYDMPVTICQVFAKDVRNVALGGEVWPLTEVLALSCRCGAANTGNLPKRTALGVDGHSRSPANLPAQHNMWGFDSIALSV